MGLKRRAGKKEAETRESVDPGSRYRAGKVFVPKELSLGRAEELKRGKERKRTRTKEVFWMVLRWGVFLVVVGVMTGFGVRFLTDLMAEDGEVLVEEIGAAIIDENGLNTVSGRVKEFVRRLESDAKENGLVIERVVLPLGKMREVDVYVMGREEYYRLSVERGSAEQAEDMGRVAKYLVEQGVVVGYVDLRVAGKAFYK